MNVFREAMRLYRIHHQITTAEMARRYGIPRTTLDHFEHRRDGAKAATVAKVLCYALSK